MLCLLARLLLRLPLVLGVGSFLLCLLARLLLRLELFLEVGSFLLRLLTRLLLRLELFPQALLLRHSAAATAGRRGDQDEAKKGGHPES